VEPAARHGVMLQRSWAVYQPIEDAQAGSDLVWLAEHVLVLEIHPQLGEEDAMLVARALNKLWGRAGRAFRP
jgi:hypothetical protein